MTPHPPATVPPGGALVTRSHAPDDHHLTVLVRASFFTPKQVKADRADIETNARVVTLRGTVAQRGREERSRAGGA